MMEEVNDPVVSRWMEMDTVNRSSMQRTVPRNEGFAYQVACVVTWG